jgi:hypothetical protein
MITTGEQPLELPASEGSCAVDPVSPALQLTRRVGGEPAALVPLGDCARTVASSWFQVVATAA